ncbi:MAG: hypothetical protein NZL92_02925 [Gloeomargarita sp. SKYG116]|nr:hypothetical protein [Gloeomargarita sp. SKYG116]MCS7226174.1 hypothetical protein [Gloeomargarita sp. SKYB31]MDW8400633.1 hypothetical protein [Gloeomargarita sp. SKYGB_i_bin116]
MKLLHLNSSWEIFLEEIASIFDFTFTRQGELWTGDSLVYQYSISVTSYSTKEHLDSIILSAQDDREKHVKARILYSLYACGYLEVTDIQYPTYQSWKSQYPGATLDHKLPIRWFPEYTFDCSNWQPLPAEKNAEKGDDFLEEGLSKIEQLEQNLLNIIARYSNSN